MRLYLLVVVRVVSVVPAEASYPLVASFGTTLIRMTPNAGEPPHQLPTDTSRSTSATPVVSTLLTHFAVFWSNSTWQPCFYSTMQFQVLV